jgi:hypothetical protein
MSRDTIRGETPGPNEEEGALLNARARPTSIGTWVRTLVTRENAELGAEGVLAILSVYAKGVPSWLPGLLFGTGFKVYDMLMDRRVKDFLFVVNGGTPNGASVLRIAGELRSDEFCVRAFRSLQSDRESAKAWAYAGLFRAFTLGEIRRENRESAIRFVERATSDDLLEVVACCRPLRRLQRARAAGIDWFRKRIAPELGIEGEEVERLFGTLFSASTGLATELRRSRPILEAALNECGLVPSTNYLGDVLVGEISLAIEKGASIRGVALPRPGLIGHAGAISVVAVLDGLAESDWPCVWRKGW